MTSTDDLLVQASEAYNAGDKTKARNLLGLAVKQDPENPRAWYVFSQVVDDKEQKIFCLEKVLEIHPDNAQATKQLETLRRLDLQQPKAKPQAPKVKQKQKLNPILGVATLLVMILVCVAIWATMDSDNGKSNEPTGLDAYVMCQLLIEDRLKAPGSTEYPVFSSIQYEQDGNIFYIKAYVDAQNSFGTLIRNDFFCVVEYVGDDKWNLKDLEMNER
jgi:hypothetical protein